MADWEREPLTPEQRIERERVLNGMIHDNLTLIQDTYPPCWTWNETMLDQCRIEDLARTSSDHDGHIARIDEIESFMFEGNYNDNDKIRNCIISLLKSKIGTVSRTRYNFEADECGWVHCADLRRALKEESPQIVQIMSMETLLRYVRDDPFVRMQFWVSKPDAAEHIHDFTHIRVVSGHDTEIYNIDFKQLYSDRQAIQRLSSEEEFKGPRRAYYYTNLSGLFRMRNDDAITVDTTTVGSRSRNQIFCSPVDIDNPNVPEGNLWCGRKLNFAVVLDFHMIVDDNVSCFYTADGRIAIQAKKIGMMYVELIYDINTGAIVYARNGIRNHQVRLNPLPDVTDSSTDRAIARTRCFVCTSVIWIGSVKCLACDTPVMQDKCIPEFEMENFINANNNSFTELPGWHRKAICRCITDGRRIEVKKFMSDFNINDEIPAEEQKNERQESTRSFTAQGIRGDKEILRYLHLEYNHPNAMDTAKRRIEEDYEVRMRYARRIVTARTSPTAAKVLMSELHKYAFECSIRNGDINQDHLGRSESD
jgi:hypothetical protein